MYLSKDRGAGAVECSGCGACASICPKNCIRLVEGKNGFLFPEVDPSQCVACHLCEKVCPFGSRPKVVDRLDAPRLTAARCRDENEVLKAASGGAFGSIVKAVTSQGAWTVFGAVMDDRLKVVHESRRSGENMDCFHKSKYVQSDPGNTYRNVGECLTAGDNVLFSGTPCQVAGLLNYLELKRIDRSGLVCVDLVCHGVPSQALFDRYIKEEERALRGKIVGVEFRHKVRKRFAHGWDSRNLLLKLEDGREVVRSRYSSRYLRAYHAFLFFRESCHSCPYANEARNGDLTIADFWGIKKFYPTLDVDRGVSLIQANTDRGKDIAEELGQSMELYPVDRDAYLKRTRGAMVQSTPANRDRAQFLNDVEARGFFLSVDRYLPWYKEYAKVEIMRRIDPRIRGRIKKMLGRG